MKLQVSEIQRLKKVKFDYELVLTEQQIKNISNLIACTPIHVVGDATDYYDDMILIKANLTGTFTVPCANTGKIINDNFNFDSEIIVSLSADLNDADIIIKGSEIDLNEILWTEVAVNVPLIKTEQIAEVDNQDWAVMRKEKTYNPFIDLKDKIK